MTTMSKMSAGGVTVGSTLVDPATAHIQAALEINPRYIDKNIHETLDRLK